jgi:asparagine synthase (glutamine-hydrolysing)
MGLWQFHRGPDDWGEWAEDGIALGHNRLSIIDIECGKQPMASVSGDIQVVFNGEIYNFANLRRQLAQKGHIFQTDHSDTEVIVNGYAEWGTGVFSRLEGMFGIGIWDRRSRYLIVARDRLGIKPVYYATPPGAFVFSSEPKAILAAGLVEAALDPASLPDYFLFRAPVHPSTLFRGISKLPPGCWCAFTSDGGFEAPREYWQLTARPGAFRSVREAEEQVTSVLEQAVVSHSIADVPVGVFLSGGVDSSLVAALLSKHVKLDAFTVGTESHLDESGFARTVAEHLGLRLHVLSVDSGDFLQSFDEWMYFNDDPVSDPSALALMLLAEHARNHGMKVMLAGEGSDELFGGYNSYLRYSLFERLARLPFSSAAGKRVAARVGGREGDYLATLGQLRFLGTAHTLDRSARAHLFDPDVVQLQETSVLDRLSRSAVGADGVREAMLFDQAVRLPDDLLPRTDRATMALSLETRVPFLDRRVVELANSLPSRWCVKQVPPQGKWLLKRIAARHVPPSVVYRQKRGFDLPLQTWLANDFRDRLESNLADQRVPGLNYTFLGKVHQACMGGDARAAIIAWQWLVLEEWYRQWILGGALPRRPRVVTNPAAYSFLEDNASAPACTSRDISRAL